LDSEAVLERCGWDEIDEREGINPSLPRMALRLGYWRLWAPEPFGLLDAPPEDRLLLPEERELPPEGRLLPAEDRELPPEDRLLPTDDRELPPDGRLLLADERELPPVDRLPPIERVRGAE
jgi:hypothetical protein